MLRVKVDGRDLVFRAPRKVTIGRDETSLICLDDPRVSRNHGELQSRDGVWVYTDLHSRNGSFVGNERVDEVTISAPTRIVLGNAENGAVLECVPSEEKGSTISDSQEAVPEDDNAAPMPPQPGPVPTPPPSLRRDALNQSVVAARSLAGDRSIIYRPELTLLRLGRADDNDIVLDDLLVSRYHAELHRGDAGECVLVDLNSHNGTFVNGWRVTRTTITEADYVTIGHHLFRLNGATLEAYVDTGSITFEALGPTVHTAAGNVLLDDISFSLGRNSFMAIVGPSGAGKSTLLNALTGFRPADLGTVTYASRDLYTAYDDLRQRIGYVPQENIVHTQLSARTALEYAAELRFPADVPPEARSQRVNEVLEELGLTERADLPIGQLSGGQQKRCSIALELLTKPSLLFLDEPTSGLDPGYEKLLMQLLRDLAKEGRTIIVVTHSLQSLSLCDRVLCIARGGKLAYFGPPDKVLTYFGGDDNADVFITLDHERNVDWKARFREHPLYDAYVKEPLAGRAYRMGGKTIDPLPPQPPQQWSRQFRTLTRRQVGILRSQPRSLLTLFLPALLLGFAFLLFLPANSFRPRTLGATGHGLMVAAALVFAATILGVANAVREIVKELPIYKRERSIGMLITAYVASKFVVLAGLTTIQVVILLVFALRRQGGPSGPATGLWPFGEIALDLILAGIAAMALALMVSALVSSSETAMNIAAFVLVLEIVLSGALLPLNGFLAHGAEDLASANAGFSAVATTIDLNGLNHPAQAGRATAIPFGANAGWTRSAAHWEHDVLSLLVLTAIPLILTVWLLYRRDPFVARSGPVMVSVKQVVMRPELRLGTQNAMGQVWRQVLGALTTLALGYLLHYLH